MAGVDTVTRRFLGTVEAHGDVTALLDPFDQERQWTFTRPDAVWGAAIESC